MDRQTAWQTVQDNVEDHGLRRHMLAVEAAMRFYAERLDADPDLWGLAGLLHDYDWEIHPTLEAHPKEGVPLLRERGCPEEAVQAILSHNEAGTGVGREKPMDYALLACDEITGLIIAATLVRPHKDIRQIKVKSVKRNWKDKLFTAQIDRGEIERFEHVGNVLEAMQGVAAELDLDGRLAS